MLGNDGVGLAGEEDRIESVLVAGGKHRVFAGPQIGNRRLTKQAEDDREAPCGQIMFENGVADNGGGGFEAALPCGFGGIAHEEALGGKTRSD